MSTPWHQANIEFPEPATAETVAADHLAPALTAWQHAGLLHEWWYMRKKPAWRLRYRARDTDTHTVRRLLDDLVAHDHILAWTPAVYEPESIAFGGATAMDLAHRLFHHDSHHILTHATTTRMLGRRETSVVLCGALLRGAGLDWYEQGDVWAKVAQLRPSDPSHAAISSDRAATLAAAMRRLMTVDVRGVCNSNDGPLAGAEEWVTAFEKAGQTLRDLDRYGRLDRGLRAVLAHQVIFHFNRAGLPAQDQATLAHLAIHTVFATTFPSVSTRASTPITDRSTK